MNKTQLSSIDPLLLSELSEHEMQRLRIDKNQVVYQRGHEARGFYYVVDGLIGLYQVIESGKESLLRIYGPGSLFGYRSLFTEQKYPATARTMLESQLIKVEINHYHALDKKAPKLAAKLMHGVCAELGQAEKRLTQFTAYSAKIRILDAIHTLFGHYPNYPWTYREIGEYSGTDTSTVIRYCKTLKQSGLLDKNTRKPTPTDLQLLSQYRQSITTA